MSTCPFPSVKALLMFGPWRSRPPKLASPVMKLLLPSLVAAVFGLARPAVPEIGPRITLAHEVVDYGTIAFGSDGRCTFPFTNTGDAPLIIQGFQSSCGCLAPNWDREPVLPGASGKVSLLYDTRRAGPFRKSATLITNDPERPRIVLSIRGAVLLPDTAASDQPRGR